MADEYDDDDVPKGRTKSRRELPAGAVATLKAWLLSPEHFTHPYPTPQDQAMLMQKTGIDKKQLKNWFTNARRRIWKPMLKKQIEAGTISATAAGTGGLVLPAGNSMDNPHSVQAMRVHYQQALQDQSSSANAVRVCLFGATDRLLVFLDRAKNGPSHFPLFFRLQQKQQVDSYGNPVYQPQTTETSQYYGSGEGLPHSNSIGQLPAVSSNTQLSKTDSHAVLMELFARDQDLVRQATESARLKAETKQQQPAAPAPAQPEAPSSQHPMVKAPSSSVLQHVPTLNSWPHFSSITSLNNLGTLPGVKSIASLSGQDLASKGSWNKMGNLAHVKSMESMGKNDSYAFLEVFFGDRSSTNLSGMGGASGQPQKNKPEEDHEIGLSLEDESPSPAVKKEFPTPTPLSPAPRIPASVSAPNENSPSAAGDSGTLKRAYDDAMAARGLMAVSRSCEKLVDLPAKIQRTLSQEFITKQQEQKVRQQQMAAQAPTPATATVSYQYPGQQATEPQVAGESTSAQQGSSQDDHVQVSKTTKCVLCSNCNVDTQVRPCGHMFHERCLKPSLTDPNGPPKCPIDDLPITSVVLAVPENQETKQEAFPYSAASTQPADAA